METPAVFGEFFDRLSCLRCVCPPESVFGSGVIISKLEPRSFSVGRCLVAERYLCIRLSLTGLSRGRVRMLFACRDDAKAEEFDVEMAEFVPDKTERTSEALSELAPGVGMAVKSLQ